LTAAAIRQPPATARPDETHISTATERCREPSEQVRKRAADRERADESVAFFLAKQRRMMVSSSSGICASSVGGWRQRQVRGHQVEEARPEKARCR